MNNNRFINFFKESAFFDIDDEIRYDYDNDDFEIEDIDDKFDVKETIDEFGLGRLDDKKLSDCFDNLFGDKFGYKRLSEYLELCALISHALGELVKGLEGGLRADVVYTPKNPCEYTLTFDVLGHALQVVVGNNKIGARVSSKPLCVYLCYCGDYSDVLRTGDSYKKVYDILSSIIKKII